MTDSMDDRVSNCIDAWVANRKKPLQLNMQDPIIFSHYGEDIVDFSDPRIKEFSTGQTVGNRYTVYIWLH